MAQKKEKIKKLKAKIEDFKIDSEVNRKIASESEAFIIFEEGDDITEEKKEFAIMIARKALMNCDTQDDQLLIYLVGVGLHFV